MKLIGVLILCSVAAFLLVIKAALGEYSKGVVVVTFLTVTAIIFALVCIVLFGVSLIIGGWQW